MVGLVGHLTQEFKYWKKQGGGLPTVPAGSVPGRCLPWRVQALSGPWMAPSGEQPCLGGLTHPLATFEGNHATL